MPGRRRTHGVMQVFRVLVEPTLFKRYMQGRQAHKTSRLEDWKSAETVITARAEGLQEFQDLKLHQVELFGEKRDSIPSRRGADLAAS